MKKLLTIICSLCLVMAFSMPVAAQTPYVDDVQVGVELEDSAMLQGNSELNTLEVGDVDVDASTDESIDTGDIEYQNDNSDESIETGDIEDNFQNNSNQDNDYSTETNTDTDTDTELLSDNEGNVSAGNCDSPNAQEDAAAAEDQAIALNDTGGDVEIGNTDDNSDTDNRQNYDNESDSRQNYDNDSSTETNTETNTETETEFEESFNDNGNTDNSTHNDQENMNNDNSEWEVKNEQENMNNDNSDNSTNNDQEWNNDQENMNNDNSEVEIEYEESMNDNSDNSNEQENMYNDNSEVEIKYEDSFNDESETASFANQEAAAAFGGTAIAIDIRDIQLNLAETNSVNGIYQESGDFNSEADTEGSGEEAGGAAAVSGIMMNCTTLTTGASGNIGNTLVNANAGNFNNQAGINSVTATIQY